MGARYYDPKGGRFLSPDPIGYPICLDLYAYAAGDPVNYLDPDGRFFSPIYQPIKATVLNVWNSPRFQGACQMLGGAAEMGAGGGIAYGSGMLAAPMGFTVAAHGADHFCTGFRKLMTGRYSDTATSQLLQKTGLPPEIANLVDNGLSVGGTMRGVYVIQRRSTVAFSNFGLPVQESQTMLYRTVQPVELADIQKTGIFRNLRNAESKYFTTSIEGASSYAKKAVKGFGDPPYTLIRTQVPNNILNGTPPTFVDGGIPAWVIPDQKLEGLIPEIMTWMAVPK